MLALVEVAVPGSLCGLNLNTGFRSRYDSGVRLYRTIAHPVAGPSTRAFGGPGIRVLVERIAFRRSFVISALMTFLRRDEANRTVALLGGIESPQTDRLCGGTQ